MEVQRSVESRNTKRNFSKSCQVVSLCRDSGDVEDQVDALIRIARLWVLRSEAEEATKAAKSALEAAQGAKKDLAEAQALLGLAGVLKAKTDLAGAQTEAGKAEKLFKKCGHRPGELAALMLSWSAMVEEGPQQVAQVVQAAKKAAEAFKSAGDQQCAAEALLEASAASREHGQVEESASTAAAALQLFRQPSPQIFPERPKSVLVVVVVVVEGSWLLSGVHLAPRPASTFSPIPRS